MSGIIEERYESGERMDRFQDILKAIQAHEAAARQSRAEADRHYAEMTRLFRLLAESNQWQLPAAGACRIIQNGQVKYVTEEKAEQLCRDSKADLVLDCAHRRLRCIPAGSKKKKAIWIKPKWGWYKALFVGMSRPGLPFGNRRINAKFEGYTEISQRTLSHDIAGLTQLLQGGGTDGPYIYREQVSHEISESGWGYVFSDRRRYLIIEGQGEIGARLSTAGNSTINRPRAL